MGTGIKFPVYDRKRDGDVFLWILQASQDLRKIRQRQRDVEFEKATEKLKSVDRAKVGN